MTRLLAQTVLLVLVTLYAWRRGGWPEKAAATAFLASLIVDQFAHRALGVERTSYEALAPWHFALDCLLLLVVVAIGLKARRTWTIWLGSLQMLAVAGHLARAVDAQMGPLVYAILERYPFWLAILVILLGTHNRSRRRRLEEVDA